MKLLLTFVFLIGLVGSFTHAAFANDQPNIVLVFLDNFGWGEPGFNGGGIVRGAETPRMDQIADEGLCLKNFNVEAQCTPSRSAIMTGPLCHPLARQDTDRKSQRRNCPRDGSLPRPGENCRRQRTG